MSGFDDYEAYDALGLAELVRDREVTPEELLEAAVARIEARNPAINAVVHEMYDEGRRTIAEGVPEGPFSGVPYLLKDLVLQYKGAPTTNGSRLFADFVAGIDFELTARLRAAGLVVIGKTNTPEMGMNASTEPVLFGPTRNPWDMERTAGGSSGGAAAAVAAGMVPAAHATDAAGSIRIPASACGVFGLKPTRARNPSGPLVGEAWSGMATAHALTRSVRDSAALLDATNGPAIGDPYWAPPPARPYLDEVGADPGRLRIAVMTGAPGGGKVDPECVAAAEAAAELCAELGHRVEEADPGIDFDVVRHVMRLFMACQVRAMIELRYQALGRAVDGSDVEAVAWAFAQEADTRSGAEYARAVQLMHGLGRALDGFLHDWDVLLTPTLARAPWPLGVISMMDPDVDRYFDALMAHIPFTPPFNMSGQPAMSVPLHWSEDGLPVGVQFAARFGAEDILFRLAAQLEQAHPWAERRPPVA